MLRTTDKILFILDATRASLRPGRLRTNAEGNYAISEVSSFTLTSRCRPIAPKAASIRSRRDR